MPDTPRYFSQLIRFASSMPESMRPDLLDGIHSHLPPSHSTLDSISGNGGDDTRLLGTSHSTDSHANLAVSHSAATRHDEMISHKTIFQTDKTAEHAQQAMQPWLELNEPDGWRVRYFDDDAADQWVEDVFSRTEVGWAWSFMDRGVLRADFLRYLLPLVEGGVYSDVDVSGVVTFLSVCSVSDSGDPICVGQM